MVTQTMSDSPWVVPARSLRSLMDVWGDNWLEESGDPCFAPDPETGVIRVITFWYLQWLDNPLPSPSANHVERYPSWEWGNPGGDWETNLQTQLGLWSIWKAPFDMLRPRENYIFNWFGLKLWVLMFTMFQLAENQEIKMFF